MKKLAVIATGWHYPLHFYQNISAQVLPEGWQMDLFCVSHREPSHSFHEKKMKPASVHPERYYLDQILYRFIITQHEFTKLGWQYLPFPNTIGDYECFNQWLSSQPWEEYNLFLITHDDNLILTTNWFSDIIHSAEANDWEILCNSEGAPRGWIRGSCEWFKPSIILKIGAHFDMSKVTLTREHETNSPESKFALNDWNNTIVPLMDFIQRNHIRVDYCSDWYRVSQYCIEGERGYISNTHEYNPKSEETGFNWVKNNYLYE